MDRPVNSKKIALRSDFRDYYDHWFDREGLVFHRHSQGGMSRGEMFEYLNIMGVPTPAYGSVFKLSKVLRDPDTPIVVYLDPTAHRGKGKVKLLLGEALQNYPRYLATEFIAAPGRRPMSLRYLQIGGRFFWLRYQSDDAWRSNCGEVGIEILCSFAGYHPTIKLPLFAIDYIPIQETLMDLPFNKVAVDFNIAPQIQGTGIESLISGRAVFEEIQKMVKEPIEYRPGY